MYTRGKTNAGFTLVELLITVVILGVLAAIAVPSYSKFVERARRSEAREALSDAAARQEQFFTDNKSYAGTLIQIGATTVTENGYYQITIPVAASLSYTLRGTAIGVQVADTECATLDLTNLRVKTSLDDQGAASDCW